MAHNNVQLEPDSRRMVTRTKNATTHPGAILQDAQRARRPKEEIEREKELKLIAIGARIEKEAADKAMKAKGKKRIAELEAIEDAAIANADSEFPRHRLKRGLS